MLIIDRKGKRFKVFLFEISDDILQEVNRLKVKKKNFGWIILTLVLSTGLFVGLSGCNSESGTVAGEEDGTSGSFKIIGSNTVEPLSVLWAEDFMKANPDVSIAVSGPGSGVGIAALIDGTTDIAQASRPMKSSEYAQARENGRDPVETTVAMDALSVVVNPSKP